MSYRVGMPGWRMFARLGVKLYARVDVHFDPEVNSYCAESPDLQGLVVSGQTLDELRDEAVSAAQVLLELEMAGRDHVEAKLRLRDDIPLHCAA